MHGGPGDGALRGETWLPVVGPPGPVGYPCQPPRRTRRSPGDRLRLRAGIGRTVRPVRERSPDGAGNRRPRHGAGARSRGREAATHSWPHPGKPVRAGASLVPGRPRTPSGSLRCAGTGTATGWWSHRRPGTATRLAYQPPAGVVAEFHSHGGSRAFFSATDDRDEQGFRIYGVVGRLDTPLPELRLRVGVCWQPAKVGHFC